VRLGDARQRLDGGGHEEPAHLGGTLLAHVGEVTVPSGFEEQRDGDTGVPGSTEDPVSVPPDDLRVDVVQVGIDLTTPAIRGVLSGSGSFGVEERTDLP
jgi:hypothetical protein